MLVDLPRSKRRLTPYAAIEDLKNGIFFSGKYQSTQRSYPAAHVVVAANYLPNEDIEEKQWDADLRRNVTVMIPNIMISPDRLVGSIINI